MSSVGLPDVSAETLVVATRNPGKLVELRELLGPAFRRVIDLRIADIAPAPEEDGLENATTFEENALAKARYFAARSGGRPVVADDSGLCVRALGGAPGVYSRRYAGASGTDAEVSEANSTKLIRALTGVEDRHAWFACAVAYVHAGHEIVCTGQTSGRILHAPTGSHGFGYDPLFWSDELGCSFGQASTAQKARVSHRARAIDQLLIELGTTTG